MILTRDELKAEVVSRLKTYLEVAEGKEVSEGLLGTMVENAIDEVIRARNYPETYTAKMVESDLCKYISNIYNLALYDYSQIGIPFEQSHSENGTSRGYMDRAKCFSGIRPFVTNVFRQTKPKALPYTKLEKIKNYLYEIHYDSLDYESAFDYFKKGADISVGGCSVVVKDGLYGRNFDWLYSNQAEFVVRTPQVAGRNQTLGISGGFADLTDDLVLDEKMSDLYKIIPFMLSDGLNNKGVVANINVVPTDKGFNRAIPTGESTVELSALMLVRYVLDYFDSAKTAVEFIQEHMTVYFPDKLHEMGYEAHFMVADADNSYVIEFVDNKAVVIENPYLTNFYLDGVEFNEDGKVYTPETQTESDNAVDTNKVTIYGSGLERYNLIVESYEELQGIESFRELLKKLYYTNAYKDKEWLTEFVGKDLTVKSEPDMFTDYLEVVVNAYENRKRENPQTWQTVHSCIYDMENLSLSLSTQEESAILTFFF